MSGLFVIALMTTMAVIAVAVVCARWDAAFARAQCAARDVETACVERRHSDSVRVAPGRVSSGEGGELR